MTLLPAVTNVVEVRGVAAVPFLLLLVWLSMSCASQTTPSLEPLERGIATITLTSPAFQPGGAIPGRYTCDGDNLSPPLEWGPVPPSTQSLVLVMDDPEAPGGIFIHWVVYDLEEDRHNLEEGASSDSDGLGDGALEGENSFGRLGYSGPCPPLGPAHTYRFYLYAVNQPLELEAGASIEEVLEAIREHSLGVGQLEGTYSR